MASKLPDKQSTAQDIQASIGKVKNAPLVTGADKVSIQICYYRG
jgi:hypothetical protein